MRYDSSFLAAAAAVLLALVPSVAAAVSSNMNPSTNPDEGLALMPGSSSGADTLPKTSTS